MIDKILKINFWIVCILLATMLTLMFIGINTDNFHRYNKLFDNVGLSAIALTITGFILSVINKNNQ